MSIAVNKTKAVERHLLEKGEIDSWTAIKEYGATRLSAIILTLRKKYPIESITNTHETRFVTYYLPKENQLRLF